MRLVARSGKRLSGEAPLLRHDPLLWPVQILEVAKNRHKDTNNILTGRTHMHIDSSVLLGTCHESMRAWMILSIDVTVLSFLHAVGTCELGA